MATIPAGDLTTLRSTPQHSKLYMIVQQPARYESSVYTAADFVWYGTIKNAPADDPQLELECTSDAASSGVTLKDGMTILVSSVAHGLWDRVLLRVHGDQTVVGGGADETIYISASSECGALVNGDFIVVLDELRPGLRFPKITESGGDLSWYKDYGYFLDSIGEVQPDDLGLTWAQLGADDDEAAEACQPPVPIMGPHVVKFLDAGETVDIDFDWSDSYAVASGGTVNAWASEGFTSHAGASWTDNVENPAAKTYSNISGMRGFRVDLEIATDLVDPIVEFRRGSRYVFTMRRPGTSSGSDPSDAEPITDFVVNNMAGTWGDGGWNASITVYGSQASLHTIREGALVIIFAEDWYGGTKESVGPNYKTLVGREEIVLIGYIADDSISTNPEYGTTSFEIVSVTGVFKRRENYPVPIENRAPSEWYMAPDLTVDRAAHHYLTWHTNMTLVCDRYQTGYTEPLAAQDFISGDTYSTIDTFLWDRLFARFLCDRYGRTAMLVDLQMRVAASGNTMMSMTNADWLEALEITEVNEAPVSVVDLGGLVYNDGLITPLLSHAPGEFSGYQGSPDQMMSLALSSQAALNTSAGRLYAYRNNQYPNVSFTMSNWRVFDIWPQEYISLTQATVRKSFSADLFIPREVAFEHRNSDFIVTTLSIELETDGPAGVTVVVPEDPPDWPDPEPWDPPVFPPEPGWGGEDSGRRIIGTDVGIFATDNIGATDPFWYSVNSGLSTADDLDCSDVKRDPWHWWTSGGTERTLWAMTGTGIWKMTNFPYGTWANQISTADLAAEFPGVYLGPINGGELNMSIETDGLYAFAFKAIRVGPLSSTSYVVVANGAVIISSDQDASFDVGSPSVKFAQHGAGQIIYVLHNRSPFNAFNAKLRLFKTINQGAAWNLVLELGNLDGYRGENSFISVPYIGASNPDDEYVIAGIGGDIGAGAPLISDDEAATFTDIPNAGPECSRVGAATIPTNIYWHANRPDLDNSMWTNDGGTTWTNLPLFPAAAESIGVLAEWQGTTIQTVLAGATATGGNVIDNLYYWRNGDAAWVSKWGNLDDYGVSEIVSIDRDTMGAA